MERSEFVPMAQAPTQPGPADSWLFSRGGQVLLVDDLATGPRPLTTAEADQLDGQIDQRLILGALAGDPAHWWTGVLTADFDPFAGPVPGMILADLRSMMATLDPIVWNIAGRATQISDWYRDNRFCGRCGAAMTLGPDRSMVCDHDGHTAYPRLSPAVIVLVENDSGQALLARNAAWSMPMFSTLAGFVEPGESVEACIRREIREEVGVEVDRIEYFDSQPWPFPNSLMLGFRAHHCGGDLVPDPTEIAEAGWYDRDDLPPIPPRGSIARAVIDDWLARTGRP